MALPQVYPVPCYTVTNYETGSCRLLLALRRTIFICFEDSVVLASSFDTFVAMLVQRCKVFPKLLVRCRDSISFLH